MYPEVLNDDEIYSIAFSAPTLQDCARPMDITDAPWKDAGGHGCGWYAKQRLRGEGGVCLGDDARANCPVACEARPPCYGSSSGSSDAQQSSKLWPRIMHLSPEPAVAASGESGVLCAVAGLDLYALCELPENRPSGEPFWPSGPWQNTYAVEGDLGTNIEIDQTQAGWYNLTNCDLLRAMESPSCALDASWAPTFLAEYETSAAITISFWVQNSQSSLSLASDGSFSPWVRPRAVSRRAASRTPPPGPLTRLAAPCAARRSSSTPL